MALSVATVPVLTGEASDRFERNGFNYQFSTEEFLSAPCPTRSPQETTHKNFLSATRGNGNSMAIGQATGCC